MRESDPIIQQRFPEAIPSQVIGLGEGLVMLGDIQGEVSIEVRAPQSVWSDLSKDSFQAVVDLEGLEAGSYDLPVKVTSTHEAVRVMDRSPESVSIVLDERQEKEMAVQVTVLGTTPLGYEQGQPNVAPSRVKVRGPKTLVERVREVSVDLTLRGEKESVERTLTLSAKDAQGNMVNGVEITPSRVTVRVPIQQESGYRDVSVKVVTQGTVASGYWISDIRVDPSTVTVYGDPKRVSELLGFVETEPVDVEKATSNLTQWVRLALPEDISLLEVDRVYVRISVSPVLGGQTIRVSPLVRGLATGLEATVSPETVEVILAGPTADLAALQAGDVQVVLNLFGFEPGTYKVSPQIIKPDSLEVQSIIPDQLEVVITES
jgi:YbbR domain-containing protein